MRLLKRKNAGWFGATAYKFSLTEFADDNIPKYAILSHTWGADGEEVTFEDMVKGTGKSKAGYKRFTFCGEQAARDGLLYFWVDTCCIIQTQHRRQCPTKRVAYAAENDRTSHLASTAKL